LVEKIGEIGGVFKSIQNFLINCDYGRKSEQKPDNVIGLVGQVSCCFVNFTILSFFFISFLFITFYFFFFLSLLLQSFCGAIQKELSEYFRLVAVLEVGLQKPEEKKTMTMRRLLVSLHEPLQRLKMIQQLVQQCGGLKGGQIVNHLSNLTTHGDPFVRSFLKNFVSQVSKPIFDMLKHWIFTGELQDPNREFFVEVNPSTPPHKLWFAKYNLRKEMIPSFLTEQQPNQILLIGKTINFLRHCCDDRLWADIIQPLQIKFHPIDYGIPLCCFFVFSLTR
jgi:hypothetical protein